MTLENAGTIDFVSHDPERDEVLLVMIQGRAWGPNGRQLPPLQAKLNTYLAFATDGQLTSGYPQLAGKPIHIQLRSMAPPGARELDFLRIVADQLLKPLSIRLSWRVIGEASEHGI